MADSRLAAVLAKKRIFVQRMVGEGRFGVVYEIERPLIKSNLAGKVFDCERLSKNYVNGKLQREIEIHEGLNHENVIKLHFVISTNCYVVLLMDLAEGTLSDLIKEGPLPDEAVRKLFKQCMSGVSYLHGLHIAHRDLKPANILLVKSVVKISDFGMAVQCLDKVTGQRLLAEDYCGSPGYAAPEVWQHKPYDALTADVWSLGIVLYELITTELPPKAMSERPHRSESTTDDLMALAYSLLEPDVTKRPLSTKDVDLCNFL